MKTWELLSLSTVAAVVGLFSGPWIAFSRSIRVCRFDVFVELVDRMNWSMAPALTVFLPSAFISLCFVTLMSLGEHLRLRLLNTTALVLFTVSLLIAAILEVPVVKQIASWPAALTIPKDWQNVRSRWLRIHLIRVVFGFASLLVLTVATGILLAAN